jgi:methyl-accepting chemotaxis protein
MAFELPAETEVRVPTEDADAEAREEARKEEATASRFRAIGELAEECLASAGKILGKEDGLKGPGSAVTELSTIISSARQSADLIRENTDKIFEISNNLANSAEQAFNLSHEVESRASSMAVELASSLAETEGLIVESKRISEILTIMSEISSTTSILSFNASIVAANAGAHGKPFAVVAKEMRKLAESTEISLKDITTIVRNIQERVEKVAGKIRLVNEGVKDEKESLVAVAGDLQGVMLANEVVRTVSGLCVQKSAEELESFRSMQERIDLALRSLAPGSGSEVAAGFSAELRKLAELAEGRA